MYVPILLGDRRLRIVLRKHGEKSINSVVVKLHVPIMRDMMEMVIRMV